MYSKKELLSKLKELSRKLGKTPTRNHLKTEKDFPSYTAFYTNFGSWNNALKAAGLEVHHQRRKWTKEEIIFWLNKKYRELGKTPGIRDFDKDRNAPGKNTVRKLFGSWTNALRATRIPVRKYYNKEELIKILQDLTKKLNRTPTRLDLNNTEGYPSYTPIVKRFGSYTAACLMAGLIPNDGRNNKIWQGWEKHCIEMAKFLYKDIEIKKERLVEGVPDIYVKDKKLFIDAKTCGYGDFKEQVSRYCKNGHKLEFWCIFKGLENRSKRVRYTYAEELADVMKQLGNTALTAKCYQFIKNIYSEDQTPLI